MNINLASSFFSPFPADDASLSQDRQTALPHPRVRAALRGGAGVLGPRLQPGRALLLDDLHRAQGHPGKREKEKINLPN